MRPDEFAIIRDKQYARTLARDERRQRLRRLAHRVASQLETMTAVPGWKAQRGKSGKKLSTCIITMNSADRIRPLLEYIRPFSDEIVVGVDSKTTDNTFEVCQGLADELFIIESTALTCNAGLEPLVAHCHGDWVLRLDDDEFPEPHFAAIKDGLMATDRYTHYKMPRLHLSDFNPQTGELWWLNDSYLYPDFQMRLFKNDKSLLTFPGAVGHASIGCAGPRGRLNTVNLIHLNLAINPRRKREEKLQKYIARLDGGWVHPVNERALLFEDFNYRKEPYRYPDDAFKRVMLDTIVQQRQAYEAAQLAPQA